MMAASFDPPAVAAQRSNLADLSCPESAHRQTTEKKQKAQSFDWAFCFI
jgi:hypothetical protein